MLSSVQLLYPPLTDGFIASYKNSHKLNITEMIYTLGRKKELKCSHVKSKYIFFYKFLFLSVTEKK